MMTEAQKRETVTRLALAMMQVMSISTEKATNLVYGKRPDLRPASTVTVTNEKPKLNASQRRALFASEIERELVARGKKRNDQGAYDAAYAAVAARSPELINEDAPDPMATLPRGMWQRTYPTFPATPPAPPRPNAGDARGQYSVQMHKTPS